MQQAASFGCLVAAEDIKVKMVDNRWYNPSKYVWYTAPAEGCQYKSVTKIVQLYKGHCI